MKSIKRGPADNPAVFVFRDKHGVIVLLMILKPRDAMFQSAWFVESLLSQTLIVHLIRTAKVPFVQSRATWPVLALTIAIMVIAIALPFTSLGGHVALRPLPGSFFAWLAAILLAYVLITLVVKGWYIRRFSTWL